jgi:deazaflavin-dependent oxidoreductase (nitroreductase family)
LKKTNPSSSSKTSRGEKYLYLTTRGRKSGQEREIEIWFTQLRGRFYVIAEYPTSQWVQNIRVGSAVKVRVADEKFSAQARILPETEPDLRAEVQALSQEKYGWGDGLVVEIIPDRSPGE